MIKIGKLNISKKKSNYNKCSYSNSNRRYSFIN